MEKIVYKQLLRINRGFDDPSTAAETNLQAFVNANNPQNLPQGVSPRSVQTSPGNYNYTATQLSNGWTVVDLTKFPSFPSWSGGSPAAFTAALQLNLRNTLPNSTPGKLFTQSGLAVPFSTAQYLGNNQGWMGPYAPIVSYQPISSSGLSALGLPTFPTGGQPTSDPLTNAGNIKLSQGLLQNYPEQYWPSGTTAPQYLVCGTQALTPKINFVGTQFSIPVDNSNYAGSPSNCNLPAPSNSCSQIFAQQAQTTAAAAGLTWQPGLPLTIEGTGFGILPVMSLPYATTGWISSSTSYLTVQDVNSQGHVIWTSPNSDCQMYIPKWSERSITVIPNLAAPIDDGVGVPVSLLTDTTPFSLAASSSCPVTAGDSITVKVINPQSMTGASTKISNVLVNSFSGSLN